MNCIRFPGVGTDRPLATERNTCSTPSGQDAISQDLPCIDVYEVDRIEGEYIKRVSTTPGILQKPQCLLEVGQLFNQESKAIYTALKHCNGDLEKVRKSLTNNGHARQMLERIIASSPESIESSSAEPSAAVVEDIERLKQRVKVVVFAYQEQQKRDSERARQDLMADAAKGFVSSDGPKASGKPVFKPVFPHPPARFSTALRPVPKLRPEMIPTPLRDCLVDISERMSCPLDYPAVSALIAVSSLVGRKIVVRPKRLDNWSVVPNLWGINIGPPGDLKTPAMVETLRPIQDLASKAIVQYEKDLVAYRAKVQTAQAKIQANPKALEKGQPSDEIDECVELILKRYILNDSTVEAVLQRLKEHPDGLLYYRDELSGFFKSLDKPGRDTDRSFYLESWNGTDSPFFSDRVGRGTTFTRAVCLSMLGSLQPDLLRPYIRATSERGADGFIPRFQLMVYPDRVPWQLVDRSPNLEAKSRAKRIFEFLDDIDPAKLGEKDRPDDPRYLRFADDAQEVFNSWWQRLETVKLRAGDDALMEFHLSKYRSLMPSLALLFHLIDMLDVDALSDVQSSPISLSAANNAIVWCDFLEEHARRIYRDALGGALEPSQRLADEIKREQLSNPFTYRDVMRKGWVGLKFPEDVEHAVQILASKNWVQVEQVGPSTNGGRPTQKIWIHPDLLPGGKEERSAKS